MSELSALNGKVQSALEKLFLQHRLLFWYDDKAEMKELFDAIEIPSYCWSPTTPTKVYA